MSELIGWCVELAIHPGQLEPFRELTREMAAMTAAESGVHAYQRFASAGGEIVHAVEWYASSAAALAHLQAFDEHFAERFARMIDERRRFTVYGMPSPALKEVLDGYGATYLAPLADVGCWP